MPEWLNNAYVGAICYTGYKVRYEPMKKELARVGLDDSSIHWHWDYPTPIKKIALKGIPHMKGLDENPPVWGCTLMHYDVLKTAYCLGYGHMMLVEDDCRFLKDVDKLWDSIGRAPADWNILMLSNFLRYRTAPASEGWLSCKSAMSGACYACDRKGMEKLIATYEAAMSGRLEMKVCDYWFDKKYIGDARLYIADPVLAVQARFMATNNGAKTFVAQDEVVPDMSIYAPAW